MLYDNAFRQFWADETRARDLCIVLGIINEHSNDRLLPGPTELAAQTMRGDAIFQILAVTDPNKVVHIEFQTRARADLIEPRLLQYYARLAATYPGREVEQHVVVLDPEGGRLGGSYVHGPLRLQYIAHHLWEIPVSEFLRHDFALPFASLGQTDRPDRVLEDVGRAIEGLDPQLSGLVRDTAAVFARIHLDPDTIESILYRRHAMGIELREIFKEEYEHYTNEGLQRGLHEGRTRGLEEGRQEGRQEAEQQARAGALRAATLRFGTLGDDVRELVDSCDPLLVQEAAILALTASEFAERLRNGKLLSE